MYTVKISILGTVYTIVMETKNDNKRYEACDGYCDPYAKEIHLRIHSSKDSDRDITSLDDESMRLSELNSLRHELVHCFMHESGLSHNSNYACQWAMNEEMIDWIALQMPKIMTAYENACSQLKNLGYK